MSTTLFTTRINPEILAGINTLSREQKQTKREVVEQAIKLYILSQKRSAIRKSFQNIGQEEEIMSIAESGFDLFHNV